MMRKALFFLLLVGSGVGMAGCGRPDILTVSSPDGRIEVRAYVLEGTPFYEVYRDGNMLLGQSRLGVVLRGHGSEARPYLLESTVRAERDTTWEQPWGETRLVRDRHRELAMTLRQADGMETVIRFRVFDDGVGFRYEWPGAADSLVIEDERTEFALAEDLDAWWIPAYGDDRYEYLYETTPVSAIEVVHTPLTMAREGLAISIHEAALTDFASMTLRRTDGTRLKADLVPWPDGVKVRAALPHVSPWRTIQIGEDAGDLMTSYLVLNLNEPNALGDASWVRPGKYVGIWWGMHVNRYTWSAGPDHGATTARVRQYIDFAAANGFDGVLVEGWNEGWDSDWFGQGFAFRFAEAYPDFDLDALSRYAAEKGVYLIGHHETGAAVDNYEDQLEEAFALYEAHGVPAVKTGYVGFRMVTRDGPPQWHHGQFGVNHYRRVVEAAARHRIMLDVHEPIKDTGIRRTYPNMMTREGARGQEYNASWSPTPNPPAHATIIPFTRGLAGPFDYTPGIFDLTYGGTEAPNRVETTLAHQLALYVVIYSPLHMAADLIENYESQPAFQFIRDVPVDWDTTLVPAARIGDFAVVVRKDRGSEDWYVGAVTDEEGRTLQVPLDFLPEGAFTATVYADGADADWASNPYAISITDAEVTRTEALTLTLAPGGGQAVRLTPVR